MKTAGINELHALVAEALSNDDAHKLADAIVRATELAEDETRPVNRDYLDARLAATASDLQKALADLRAELQQQIAGVRTDLIDKMRTQQMWTVGTFILLLVSVVLQHFWKG
jgi:hypothetical protein